MQEFVRLFLSFIMAMAVTSLLIPMWISVCNKWKLFDFPDSRKIHAPSIPTMGGLAIYAGVFMSFFLFADINQPNALRFVICASVLLFFTGFFDDLLDLPAKRKLVIQIIAAFIVVCGGTRISNLYGIVGINQIPVWAQYPVTMFFIIAVTNAYNLIDGIDGLAGGLGVIGSLTFGFSFLEFGQHDLATLSFCISGSLIGFLYYNFHPAKIFMGDTGSLLIGFILSALAVNLLSVNELSHSGSMLISPAFIAAILFVPLYDIFRVFVIRILNGDSPLKADRNHLHHMIIKQGFTHRGASFVLYFFSLSVILLQVTFSNININQFIILGICLAVLTLNTFTMQRLVWFWRKINRKAVKKLEVVLPD
jgi:UDP-GlcNAc:undecaprenyl-phosphate/decaprenyl-phosphate GlcNAc-1-phosphate transferase